MKKKITALALALCMAFSSANIMYAEDTNVENSGQTDEQTTETTTERAAEPVTEAETKSQKEDAKSEPSTSSGETTTKKSTSSSTKTVSEDYSITINEDASKSLSSYVSGAALSDSDFSWKTSDSDVATVSSRGKITGKDSGTCTITATALDGNTKYVYTFDVKVRSSSSSSKTKSITIDVDDDKDLYDYVDDDYSASKYTWESSASKYVSVTSKGVITGEKKGSATVTATYDSDDVYLEYKFKITVEDDDDDDNSSSSRTGSSSKTAVKTSWDIYAGTNDKVDISSLLEDDPDEYEWNVDDEDIAEIDEDDGVIKGLEEGETDIQAEGDRDYTFTVYVNDDYSTDEMTIKGKTTNELDDYLDDDADEYKFTSDRKAVASVNSKGEVTGVANGIATIVCEHDDGDIIQIFVTVTGISTALSTTTETTTETTTSSKTNKTNKTNNTSKTSKTNNSSASVSFNDISHRAWAADSIKAMASKGYIVGVGADKFSPDASCKRCDFTIVLIKILGLDNDDANSEYDDISTKDYYYRYVMIALTNGIESGVINNKFRPDDYITREEMMAMVYKGLVKTKGNMNTDTSVLNKYTDAGSISAENRAAAAALINSGAISGTSDTTLEPKAKITRAQMAVIMNKVDETVN